MSDEDIFLYTTIGLGAVLGLLVLIKCTFCCCAACSNEHSHIKIQGKGLSNRSLRKDMNTTCMTNQPYFLNKDNLYIYWTCWEPKVETKAIIVICHGLNSHSGRFHHVAKTLNAQGIKVYALDHQGHGRSEGDRIFVKDANDFADDVVQFLNIIKETNENDKIFMFGHSMGGLIATLSTIKAEEMLTGTILSAPALYLNPAQAGPATVALLTKVAYLFPKARLKGLDLSTLTQDVYVRDHFANDPLRANKVPTLSLSVALINGMQYANENAAKIEKPFLMLHGTADDVVVVKGSEEFIEKVSSEDKKLIHYENIQHEILNEPEECFGDKEHPINTIINFIEERCS